MKSSKTLTSILVAAAMVGGIGLAYAQTGSNQGAGSGTAPGNNAALNSAPAANSGAPMGATTMGATTDSSMAAPSTSDTSSFKAERPAQADRN